MEQDPWESHASEVTDPWEQAVGDHPDSLLSKAIGAGKTGLQYGMKGLGYLGGLSRAALAGQIDNTLTAGRTAKGILQGKSTRDALMDAIKQRITTPEDMQAALKGEAPTSAEYLARAGVPEGYSLSDALPSLYSESGQGLPLKRHGTFDPTARGGAGLALDVATDPLTYLSGGTSMLGKEAGISRGLSPVGEGLQAGGKSLYKSGLKRVDEAAAKYGKVGDIAPSEILFNEGVTGSNKKIAKAADSMVDQLREKQKELLSLADEANIPADMGRSMQPAQATIDEMIASKDPALKDIADAYAEKLAQYANINAPSATQVQGMKSNLYNSIGGPQYQAARMTKPGMQIQKDMARGLKDETERLVEQAQAGKGAELADTNAKMGSLLTAGSTLDKEGMKEVNKNLLTSVDPMIYSAVHAASDHPHGGVKALLLKKLADLSKETYFRTKAGMGMHNLGQLPLLDPALRNMYLENQRPVSPWTQLK